MEDFMIQMMCQAVDDAGVQRLILILGEQASLVKYDSENKQKSNHSYTYSGRYSGPPLLSYCICWNMRDHRYFPVNYADTKVFHSKAGGKQGKSQHSKNHIHSTQYSKNTAFEYNSPANKSVHVRFNPCDNFLETYKLIKSHCNEQVGCTNAGSVTRCSGCFQTSTHSRETCSHHQRGT